MGEFNIKIAGNTIPIRYFPKDDTTKECVGGRMKDMDWHNMRTRLEALYVLDNALTGSSEEGLRLV